MSKHKELIARIATIERKLVFSKLRIYFLEAEIKSLNKIIEKELNLSGQQVSNDGSQPGYKE